MPSDNPIPATQVAGEFVDLDGERYYVIEHVDQMPPFLVNLVSDSDHWMFIASNGGLTAGRVSPETAIFPYITVDNLYESTGNTGSRTLFRTETDGEVHLWEPFNYALDRQYSLSRHLYRNYLGNKIRLEEINHDLQLRFAYGWSSSDEFGFVRSCEVENLGTTRREITVLDGLQNLLPAGTPRYTQTNSSYLVDAYKLTQLQADTGLAMFTLYSAITDRAEPQESLRANTAFCLGIDDPIILLSSDQVQSFQRGRRIGTEHSIRGKRGAYLVSTDIELEADESKTWQIVLGSELSQADCSALQQRLTDTAGLAIEIQADVEAGSDRLARIMAAADACQVTAEETVYTHHYANVLYNVLRGGIPDDQYRMEKRHFVRHLALFNRPALDRHRAAIDNLPDTFDLEQLKRWAEEQDDEQLQRLALEYLPITFGRRHGDPSRPWNQFKIELKDSDGRALLNYQGNWRDIFQNWEALLLGFPDFCESVVAKFVNASTMDGYNPYRITSEGIDWEIEDPDDPWSYIGYWGDHQIIYLLKLLEISRQYHPEKLGSLLGRRLFAYANVPYRIKSFADLVADPKSTVLYDTRRESLIEQRVEAMGADGKMVLNSDGEVHQVNLAEKLLVPLLAKISNLVIDGGIWLNTQRPEWNDANNALVGQGLSMVTLYYLRRYMVFLQDLLPQAGDELELSSEVALWLDASHQVLLDFPSGQNGEVSDSARYQLLSDLGQAASSYRETVYDQGISGADKVSLAQVQELLSQALQLVNASIASNRGEDCLYHAYNLLDVEGKVASVGRLYGMLEGQVAVLSSGALAPEECVTLVESLFDSNLYREDQHSFLLYPDRDVPGFLDKNTFAAAKISDVKLVALMHARSDYRLIQQDASGKFRFHPDIVNVNALNDVLQDLEKDYGEAVEQSAAAMSELYEYTFNHRAFTGRSGGMFAFEGLGSIYWHMVSKLLLAVQESYHAALDTPGASDAAQRLGELYYRVRAGIGFNKTPAEYGALPTDPYSHTPAHMGAQQPGMTGQVKEEILARWGELGLRVLDGEIHFNPSLLRVQEFCAGQCSLRYLDTNNHWQVLHLPDQSLAYTFCQVPIIYALGEGETSVQVTTRDGNTEVMKTTQLPRNIAGSVFERRGEIARIEVSLAANALFQDQ